MRWHPRGEGNNLKTLDVVAQEWNAGAELELLGVFGRYADEDRAIYRGIGLQREEVLGAPARTFRHTPDSQGLLGHRLNWAVRQLHFVSSHAADLLNYGHRMVATFGYEGASRRQAGRARDAAHARRRPTLGPRHDGGALAHSRPGRQLGDDDLDQLPWQYDAAMRIGCRAAAFMKEKRPLSDRAEDSEAQRELHRGLRRLAAISRASRNRPPIIDRWCRGDAACNVEAVRDMRDKLEIQLHDLAARRAARSHRETRRWAQLASLAISHRVTKTPEAVTSFSASASKAHLGAMGPQEAADHGMDEWAPTWKVDKKDITEEIMQAVEAVEVIDRLHDELVLPPFTDDRLFASGRTLCGRTAIGTCGMRPRHLLLLTRAARRALCLLLEMVERARRWPNALRAVVEVALSKRTGGSRLIGLATTIYRLWARMRDQDCRAVLEERIERPFLAAAPKRGAARAAFDAARLTEATVARDQSAAATLLDIAQYYEYIEPAEYAISAIKFGLPKVVVALATHIYLAPRRIRVRAAYSIAVVPRRSVVAGCTWATVLIRLIVIPLAERLLEQIRGRFESWGMRCHLSIYVDDVLAVSMGSRPGVALLHAWITRLVLNFIKVALRKKTWRGIKHRSSRRARASRTTSSHSWAICRSTSPLVASFWARISRAEPRCALDPSPGSG